MRKTGIWTRTLFMLGLLITVNSAAADESLVSAGTMTTGGYATFNIARANAPVLFKDIDSSVIGWNVDLTFGYFVLHGWEIDLGVSTGGTFASPSLATVGFGVGTRYYFDLGGVFYPYIGTLPTFNYNSASTLWTFRAPAMVGFLIALNCAVALDFGVSAGFNWALNPQPKTFCNDPDRFGVGTQATGFDLAVGYFGVKAFF